MRKPELFPERQIVNRIKANDRSVLGELFTQYQRRVCAYVTRHTGSDDDAEDMLQEAIIVLWQNVCSGKFEQKARIGTYLLAVVKNKWRSELRKRKHLSRNGLSEDQPDENPDALNELEATERNTFLHEALKQLGTPCRELLLLFYFEERTMSDIARILGFANPDVAKAKKYQCKKALEQLLNKTMTKP
jgi:RNA polymerase sigma factor (sigma-70 family)